MSSKTDKIIIAILCGIFMVTIGLVIWDAAAPARTSNYGDVNTGNYDTVTQGIISATTTVNTTSTLVIAFGTAFTASASNVSATKWATVINNGSSSITCSTDDRGTTAPSSSVAIFKGFVIGISSTNALPSLLSFGQCSSFYNCIPAMGNVSCLSNSPSAITNITVIRK